MEMKKYSYETKMSIKDWRDFAEDEDIHFAVAKLDFLTTSTREHYNSHKHLISKEVLMEYAPSFLGKCLVSDFDGKEYQGHTESQTIVGYIYPSAMQDIEYYEDEDGITHATAIGVISKIYATSVYNQFIKDGNKCNVSVEMLSGFTEETMNIVDGFDFKDCVGFDGCGVTFLGTTLQPSVKGANISITKFSDDEIKIALDKYQSIENEDINDIILSKLNNIENILNKEDDRQMDKKITKFAIEIGSGLWDNLHKILVEKYPSRHSKDYSDYWIRGIYEEDGDKYVIVCDEDLFKIKFSIINDEIVLDDEMIEVKIEFIEKYTEQITTYEQPVVDKKEDKDDKGEDKVEEDEMEKMKTKCSELEKQVEDYKVEKANYETKITALEKFKADVELSQKQEIIDTTMAKAKELVKETDFDVKKFDTYIEDSTKCDLDNIGAWKNSVMAEVAMFAIDNNKTKTVTEFDVGVPIIKETKKTIYDL